MTASTVDQLVSDYLSRLETAAASLPPGRRAELLDEIREHIDTARAAGAAADEAAVRTMLDRLGEPDEIVDAAREAEPGTESVGAQPAMVEVRPGTGLELAAVLLLTVGSFVLLVGWAIGAVLLWRARRWTTREKLLGTLVVPGGPGLVFWLGSAMASQTCMGETTVSESGTISSASTCTGFALPPWLGVPLLIAALIAPFVVAGVLYSRARTRAALEPVEVRPVRQPSRQGSSPWGGSEIAAVLLLGASGLLALVLFGLPGIVLGVAVLTVGLVLVWTSPQWTQREKLIGTAIAAPPAGLAIVAAALITIIWRTF